MDRTKLLGLYRQLLRYAVKFPSRNRRGIYDSIQYEFRRNRAVTEPKVLQRELQRAVMGLDHMRQYVDIDRSQRTWDIDLTRRPKGM